MAQFLMATAVVTVTLQVAISEPTGSDWSTGWCSNWKQLPDRNQDGYVAEYGRTFFNNPVDEEDCAAKCRAHPNCKQAVYESEGPWGKECWLGGQVSEKKETGSRKNTQDYCYHPCKTRFTQEEDDTAFAAKMEELCPVFQQVQSKNYPSFHFGVLNREARILRGPIQNFRLVPALTGDSGAISFQSTTDPNKYLRHAGFVMWLHPNDGSNLFRKDASFHPRNNRFFEGFVSFESVNFPNFFIRHRFGRLQINRKDSSNLYKNDASFLLKPSESESGSADLTGNAKLCGGQKMQSNHFLSLRSSLGNGLFTSSSLSTRCKAHCVGDIRDPKRYFVWGGNCWKRKKFSSSKSAKCKKNSEEFDELIKWERERISRCEA